MGLNMNNFTQEELKLTKQKIFNSILSTTLKNTPSTNLQSLLDVTLKPRIPKIKEEIRNLKLGRQ